MSEELKPCPFCGGDAFTGTIKYTEPPYENEELKGQLLYHSINCAKCLATLRGVAGYITEAEAITSWNTRAPASPRGDVVARLRAIQDRLSAPSYWMSGSPDGHEGENAAPFEAAVELEEIIAALTSLKASALPSGNGWRDTKHKWNDGRPGYGYQCIYCGTIASYVNGHSNSLDDCPQRTGTSK